MNWQNKEEEIKHILETQEFEYDERDWTAMEKMLRQKKSKKRAIKYSLLLLLLLSTSVAVWWLYNSTGADTDGIAIKQEQTEKQAATSSPGSPININGQNIAEKGTATDGNTLLADAGNTVTQHVSDGTENSAIQIQQAQQSISDGSALGANNSTLNPASGNNSNTGGVQGGDADGNSNDNLEGNTETNTPGGEALSPENNNNNEENSAQSENQIAQNNTGNKGKSIPTPDTAEESVRKVKPDVEKPSVNSGLSVVLGANYSRLLQSTERNYLSSPYFSIQYNYGLGKHWQFATGLAYSMLNGDGLNKQFTATQHTFGESHTSITISTSRLQYIEMPIFAKYRLNKWNLVGGLNAAYLLSTKNTVDERVSNIATGSSTNSSAAASRYMRGLNTWDLQLQLGLERKLGRYLSAGLLANGGLLDVGRNGYYPGTGFERNVRLQFYIRYEFFKF